MLHRKTTYSQVNGVFYQSPTILQLWATDWSIAVKIFKKTTYQIFLQRIFIFNTGIFIIIWFQSVLYGEIISHLSSKMTNKTNLISQNEFFFQEMIFLFVINQ